MNKPAGTITLSSADGEALIAQIHQSNLPHAQAGMVEQIIRMYFWLVFALQEAHLSIKRLRTLVFGASARPKERPVSATSTTLSEAPDLEAGGAETAPVAEGASGLEAGAEAAGSGESSGVGAPTPKGGHRAGTGRLGADA